MEAIITNIIKLQNAHLLRQISEEFNIPEHELSSKYLRPTFYLPDIREQPAVIECVDDSSSAVLDVQLAAVDALVAKLRARRTFDEDDNRVVEEFKQSLINRYKEKPRV
jgi:hypothetical protein